MRLLSLLSNLILESGLKRKFLSQFAIDGEGVKLFASPHQYSDRFGNDSFNSVRNYYFSVLDNKRMKESEIRFAVPDTILKNLVYDKFEQIKSGFDEYPDSYKIRFVFRNEDNEYEEKFDYIEFVLAKSDDMKTFTIVTSSYSDDGNYLRRMGQYAEQDPRVILENFDLLPTVFL
jgi:hypothetical protein